MKNDLSGPTNCKTLQTSVIPSFVQISPQYYVYKWINKFHGIFVVRIQEWYNINIYI